jgi:hypothetical protein
MRTITPQTVVRALAGLKKGTSEWDKRVSELRVGIVAVESHPDAWLSAWWTSSLARLQLDLCCSEGQQEPRS